MPIFAVPAYTGNAAVIYRGLSFLSTGAFEDNVILGNQHWCYKIPIGIRKIIQQRGHQSRRTNITSTQIVNITIANRISEI